MKRLALLALLALTACTDTPPQPVADVAPYRKACEDALNVIRPFSDPAEARPCTAAVAAHRKPSTDLEIGAVTLLETQGLWK